jgi:class 3 adenylate cyclase/tetratricopeptide (TPR) repeat protein
MRVDTLREGSELSEAHSLASYLPALTRARIATRNDGAPRGDRSHGALLFLDVSGFTRLTEQFSAAGPEGAERLADAFDACFGRIFARILERGGDVLAFAGDAVLALWPARENDLAHATHHAASCGRRLLEELGGHELGNGEALRLRAALGAGEIDILEVGGVGGRWECFVLGDALGQARRADAVARPGGLSLSPEASRLLAGSTPPAGVPPSVPATEVPLGLLRAHVPRFVVDRETAGQHDWLAEFRTVTVLFAHLADVERSDSQGVARLHAAAATIQALLTEYTGWLHQFLADDKGTRAVAAFGLPTFAHADDAARAVSAALEMRRQLEALGISASIGVATGRIFGGVFGCTGRAEYAIRGSTVNRAARLMAVADGAVLCDAPTVRAAGDGIAFTKLTPLILKGIAEPVPVYRPSGVEERRPNKAFDSMPPKIGRSERARLDARIDALGGGRGGLVVVTGEAGMGKSHLVASVLAAATESKRVRVLRSSGESVERSTAYFAWRELLRQILAPGEDPSPAQLRATLLVRLAEGEAGLVGWAPVLGGILPLDLPETDVTSQMDAAGRADSTEKLVVHLLAQEAARTPTVLFVDDAHWLDSRSRALVRAVARQVTSLLTLVASRPRDETQSPDSTQLLDAEDAETIALAPMDASEVAELVRRRLGVRELPEAIGRFVYERAEGHPLYSREIALGMVESGLILVEGDRCRLASAGEEIAVSSFPRSLEGVITSRIDRLGPGEQLVVKTASVLGRVFSFDLLCELLGGMRAGEVRGALGRLERQGVMRGGGSDDAQEVAFTHIMMQKVSYELIPFAQRRALHRRAAQWMESTHARMLEPVYPLLAHHWKAADDAGKAIECLEKAAEHAFRGFSNREAVSFLREALALADQAPGQIEALRRARWERVLGEACVKLADYGAARTHLLASLRLYGLPRPVSRGALVGNLVEEVARQALHRKRRPVAAARSREVEQSIATAYLGLAEVSLFDHDLLGLAHATLMSLNHGERGEAVREVVFGYGTVGITCSMLGLRDLGRRYRGRSLDLAERDGNLGTLAFAHQIAATFGNYVGDWDDVDASCVRAIDLFGTLGDRFRWQSCQAIRGYMFLARGESARAHECFAAAFSSAFPDGAPQVQMWACAGELTIALARGEVATGAIAEVERVLARGLAPAEETLGAGTLALAYERRGDEARALDMADRGLAILRAQRPTTSYTHWSVASVADAYLAAWARRPGDASLRARASAVASVLRTAARAMPVVGPRASIVTARVAALEGHRRSARHYYRLAAVAAQSLCMPAEQTLAERELAELRG